MKTAAHPDATETPATPPEEAPAETPSEQPETPATPEAPPEGAEGGEQPTPAAPEATPDSKVEFDILSTLIAVRDKKPINEDELIQALAAGAERDDLEIEVPDEE